MYMVHHFAVTQGLPIDCVVTLRSQSAHDADPSQAANVRLLKAYPDAKHR